MKIGMIGAASLAALGMCIAATPADAQTKTKKKKVDPAIARALEMNDWENMGGPPRCYDPNNMSAAQVQSMKRLGGEPCEGTTVRATKPATVTRPAAAAPTVSRNWIVGRWSVASKGCASAPDLIVSANGRYDYAQFELGDWQLVGDTLTVTARAQYEPGQSPVMLPRPSTDAFTVKATGPNGMSFAPRGHAARQLVRCR